MPFVGGLQLRKHLQLWHRRYKPSSSPASPADRCLLAERNCQQISRVRVDNMIKYTRDLYVATCENVDRHCSLCAHCLGVGIWCLSLGPRRGCACAACVRAADG